MSYFLPLNTWWQNAEMLLLRVQFSLSLFCHRLGGCNVLKRPRWNDSVNRPLTVTLTISYTRSAGTKARTRREGCEETSYSRCLTSWPGDPMSSHSPTGLLTSCQASWGVWDGPLIGVIILNRSPFSWQTDGIFQLSLMSRSCPKQHQERQTDSL